MFATKNMKSISHVRYFFKKLFQQKSKIIATPTHKTMNNKFGQYDLVEPWTVSVKKVVPSHIPKPLYSESTIPCQSPKNPEIKNQNQIECMGHSCSLAKRVLNQVQGFIKPGITTDLLDEYIHELIINNAAYPSPLNYKGFPKSVCTSVNNVACHGIPDNRPLQDGDILNVDVTVYLNGYHGDCSAMFEVGNVDAEAKRLIEVTQLCLRHAIELCKPNENFNSIGNIIEETANKHGFNVIPAFVGHGIGNYFHGPPDIYHIANDMPGKMQPGMTFTIEPVITQGSEEIEICEDGWTAVTVDKARTAQCEHTILITNNGCEILTL